MLGTDRESLEMTNNLSTPNQDTSKGEVDKAWIQVQKNTFTNWVNDKLKGTDYSVEEISKDFEDGVMLITLLLVLAPGKKMPGR